jgi:hypothetical protein
MPRSSEWSLPLRLSSQNFVRISHLPMRATCPVQVRLFWFYRPNSSEKPTNYEVLRFVIFFSLLSLHPLRFEYSPQRSFSNTLNPLMWETKFHIRTKQQINYSCQMRRQRSLKWTVATILHSAINLFMNAIFICCRCSQIFKLCHILKGFISYYAVILSCSLVTRQFL